MKSLGDHRQISRFSSDSSGGELDHQPVLKNQKVIVQRDIALDITKGIGILLVILGHCDSIPYMPLRHLIFTFHMPLFFLASGYLYRAKGVKEALKKDFRHLGLPYVITCLAIVLFYFLYFLITKSHNSEPLRRYLIASLWGSGTTHTCKYLSHLPAIGAIWFLPALLICKNVYNVLPKNNRRLVYSSVIFVAATIIGRYLIYLPFSALSGLSGIVFYAIGDSFKKVKRIHPLLWILGLSCWFLSFKYSRVSLVHPRLDLYFIDVIGATTATLLVYLGSRIISHTRLLMQSLSWLGKNSLYILCFHLIDLDCLISNRLNITGNASVEIILMFLLPLIGTFFLTKALTIPRSDLFRTNKTGL